MQLLGFYKSSLLSLTFVLLILLILMCVSVLIKTILRHSSHFVRVLLISIQLQTDTQTIPIFFIKYRNWYILSFRLLNYRFQHGQKMKVTGNR